MPIFLRSFRIVCAPEQISSVEEMLSAEGYRFEPEPFSPWCYKLLCEPQPIGSSLAAFFGYIYIQDRSSMLPPLALNPPVGSSILDMAASPGSKTGFLGQLTGKNGFVLANEPNPVRLATLRANLSLANLLQCATISYAGERLPFPAGSWEYILLDPPCSGWGTVQKNPKATKIWQGKKITKLIALQRALLTKAAAMLTKNGRLLYSTCTTNPDENEAQTDFAIQELGLESVPLAPFAGFRFKETRNGALLVDGDASQSQGFYLSLLTKYESTPPLMQQPVAYPCIFRSALAGPVCDPRLLPPGIVASFLEKIRFICRPALLLPKNCKWQGPLLGQFNYYHFHPLPRLRSLLPKPESCPDAPRIFFDNLSEINLLLSGKTMTTEIKDNYCGLWWHNLPLANCQIKNGRLIANLR